jgi:hypothetical protein
MKRRKEIAVRTMENNIQVTLRETGCGCIDWILLALDRDK